MSNDRLRDRAADRAKRGADAARRRGRKEVERSRKGLVIFITSDKVLQAVLTGAVTGVVFSFNEGVAAYVQRWLGPAVPVYVPVKLYAAIGAALIVVLAYYADRHTEEWREYVREATGERVADDTASDEDVAGEEKEG